MYLDLGWAFAPHNKIDNYETIKDVYMFTRNLIHKFMFDKERLRAKEERDLSESIKYFKMEDFRALRDFIFLLEENEDTNTTDTTTPVTPSPPINKFKPKSKHFPDLSINHKAWAFLHNIVSDIKRMHITSKASNLTLVKRQTISKLQNHPDVVIKAADKGGNIEMYSYSRTTI